MVRKANAPKDHLCVRCGIPSAGFSCRDCYYLPGETAMVKAWKDEAKAAWRKRSDYAKRVDALLADVLV